MFHSFLLGTLLLCTTKLARCFGPGEPFVGLLKCAEDHLVFCLIDIRKKSGEGGGAAQRSPNLHLHKSNHLRKKENSVCIIVGGGAS